MIPNKMQYFNLNSITTNDYEKQIMIPPFELQTFIGNAKKKLTQCIKKIVGSLQI